MLSPALLLLMAGLAAAQPAESMPDWPSKFHTIIEGNILNKGYSFMQEEWYDYDANVAFRQFRFGNQRWEVFEHFADDQQWIWGSFVNGSWNSDLIDCFVRRESTQNRLPFRDDDGSANHVKSAASWFLLSGQEAYLGDGFSVRGIPAKAWGMRRTNTTMRFGEELFEDYDYTFYWADKDKWTWFGSHTGYDIPVRARVNGTHRSDNGTYVDEYYFDHLYEFVSFQAGEEAFVSKDWSYHDFLPGSWVKECNTTAYCAELPNDPLCSEAMGPSLPSFPLQYRTEIEFNMLSSEFGNNGTFLMNEYYDFLNGREHVVYHMEDSYWTGAFHAVALYEQNQEWSYIWNTTDDSLLWCRLELPESDPDKFSDKYGIVVDNGYLAGPAKTMLWNLTEETWMGYSTVRGIAAESWSGDVNVVFGDIMYNTTIEYFFAREYWDLMGASTTRTPLRATITGTNTNMTTGQVSDYIASMEIVGFWPDVPQGDWLWGPPDAWASECNITQPYCDALPDSLECNPPPKPEFPNSYQMVIEGNDALRQRTYLLELYYDYDNNREHVMFHYNSSFSDDTWHELVLLDEGQIWKWAGDRANVSKCSMEQADLTARNIGMGILEDGEGHLASPAEQFRFDDDAVWMGYATVRGIEAEVWAGEYSVGWTYKSWSGTFNVSTTYYFAKEDWTLFGTQYHRNPLRMKMEGFWMGANATDSRSGNVSREYEIVDFWPLTPDDSNFAIPVAAQRVCDINYTYCDDYPQADLCDFPAMPSFPASFSTTVEAKITNKGYTAYAREYYDGVSARARFSVDPMYGSDANVFHFNMLEVTDNVWLWGDTEEDGEFCRREHGEDVQRLGQLFFGTNGVMPSESWFGWIADNAKETYIGVEMIRGIKARRWDHTGSYVVPGRYATNFTLSTYFLDDSLSLFPGQAIPLQSRLIGQSVVTNTSGDFPHDYDHTYEYVDFQIGVPNELLFAPPSEKVCNFTKWCQHELQSADPPGQVSSSEEDDDMCETQTWADISTTKTECYCYDACGCDATAPSPTDSSATEVESSEDVEVAEGELVLIILGTLLAGVLLGICGTCVFNKRREKRHGFQTLDSGGQL